MRVTQNTQFNTVRDTIRSTKERMEKLQEQASSLKKLNTPSDDPVGAAKVLEVRTDQMNNDQFTRSAKMAESFLNHSDHAIESLAEIAVRAKEIALSQSSGASSTDDTRLGVAEEVTQLYQQAVAAANTKIGDRYIFGGYKTNEAPVNPDGEYKGDAGGIMAEISKDIYLNINVPGIEVFNTNPTKSADWRRIHPETEQPKEADGTSVRAPASAHLDSAGDENVNLFNELQSLRIGLLTGDLDGIRTSLERFDQIHSSLIANRSKVGSRIAGLNNSVAALDRHNLTNAQLVQNIEDADMSQVMSDLAKEETVLNSVLGSSKRLIQPTLMDFLK